MLPFLKNRNEASGSGPEQDDGPADGYGMLDAIAEDLMEAIHSKDKALLKGALEALCEYLQEEDEEQDEEDLEQQS